MFPQLFGLLCVSIVVCLNYDQVVGFWVNNELSWCVLQWPGNLVEDSSQFLQSQNSTNIQVRCEQNIPYWNDAVKGYLACPAVVKINKLCPRLVGTKEYSLYRHEWSVFPKDIWDKTSQLTNIWSENTNYIALFCHACNPAHPISIGIFFLLSPVYL